MKWGVPRANKAPSGSPALSPSTGLNESASSTASSIVMVASFAPLLFLCLEICALVCWITLMVNATLMWAASAAASLLRSNVFRVPSRRQIMLFVTCVALVSLLGFHSTSPSSASSLLSDAPLPQRIAFVAQCQPQPQPSPRMLYGGEAEEAIRYMQMECEPGEPLQETAFPAEGALSEGALSEAAEQWLVQLEEEIRLINELPFVKPGSLTFRESEESANLNKVEVAVWCCWSGSQFKRPVACCDEKEKPTHLEAARALRCELIQKHGQPDHPTHPRAAGRRAALEEAGEVEPTTAFDRLRFARMAQRRVQAQVAEDDKAFSDACAAEQRAAAMRVVVMSAASLR